jgi:hypothetical protein
MITTKQSAMYTKSGEVKNSQFSVVNNKKARLDQASVSDV